MMLSSVIGGKYHLALLQGANCINIDSVVVLFDQIYTLILIMFITNLALGVATPPVSFVTGALVPWTGSHHIYRYV